MKLFDGIREWLARRILGIEDTPHRIALGVFLGCLVGATPTLGLQILIYLATAAVFRANKVSGLPIVFVTNPVTSVPFYYFAWHFGGWVMGSGSEDPDRNARVLRRFSGAGGEFEGLTNILTREFWARIASTLWDMGAELWVGCLILGGVAGVAGYGLTYWGVIRAREARAKAKERRASLRPSAPPSA